MSAVDGEPSVTESGEQMRAAPAGLEPGMRTVVAGRYRLLSEIAEGGMGAVYVAEHTLSKNRVALKVLHPHLCRGPQGVERFRREVSAAAQIDHPGIVKVFDAGTDDDGGFFMAMELLEGDSLGDKLRDDWPGMATAVKWIEAMLEPLAKAHAEGFVHRDLKPDNVFVAIDEEGQQRIKLLDFGLAREVAKGGPTRTGITFGTPEYMSPEQAMSARKVRAPGDVWSVGVMLYELLSGLHPFDGETPHAIMANAIKDPLVPLRKVAPHVPPELAAVVERALEKEPADRPQTAGEMLEELRAVTATLALDQTVPQPPVQSWDEAGAASAESSDYLVASSPTQPRTARSGAAAPAPESSGSRTPLLIALVAAAFLGVGVLGAAAAWIFVFAPSDPPEMVARELPNGDRPAEPPAELPADAPAPAEEPEATPAAEPETPDPESAEAAGSEAPDDPEAPDPEATEPATRRTPRRGRSAPAPQVRAMGPSPLEAAQQCMRNNDRACAINALEGRARTAAELEMLIGLYRTSGRIPQALDSAERYVARYGRRPQADGYRAFLRQYGR